MNGKIVEILSAKVFYWNSSFLKAGTAHAATFTDSHPHVPIESLRLPPITEWSPISQQHDGSVRLCSARFHCFTLLMFFLESIRRRDWSLQLSIKPIVANHSNLVLHLENAKWMAKIAQFNDNVNCIRIAQSEHEYSTKFQQLWNAKFSSTLCDFPSIRYRLAV